MKIFQSNLIISDELTGGMEVIELYINTNNHDEWILLLGERTYPGSEHHLIRVLLVQKNVTGSFVKKALSVDFEFNNYQELQNFVKMIRDMSTDEIKQLMRKHSEEDIAFGPRPLRFRHLKRDCRFSVINNFVQLNRMKIHVVLGENEFNEKLIEKILKEDDGIIAVVDPKYQNSFHRNGNVIYTGKSYLKNIRDANAKFVFHKPRRLTLELVDYKYTRKKEI
jgi:hypothetical protein